MACTVLTSLLSATAGVEDLPVPAGLGADVVLVEQVAVLAGVISRLQRELAVRMAALERADPRGADVRGEAVRAGLDDRRARLLRRLGRFTETHDDVQAAWRSGKVRIEQVDALRAGAAKLPTGKRRDLVDAVLPLLPGLDDRASREVIDMAVDQLAPGDPDHDEASDHAARRLAWTRITGGGLAFEGYLPALEAGAFTGAINALVESLRVAGDQLTPAQRRADALTSLVATATEHGLPSGGGLPAAVTLTVSLTEATRVASRDPARHGRGIRLRPKGTSTINNHPASDATVRFGICCAAITPILTDHPGHQHADDMDSCGAGWSGADGTGGGGSPGNTARGPDLRAGADGRDPTDPPDHAGTCAGSVPGMAGMGSVGDGGASAPALGSLLARIAATPVQPLAVGRSVRLATAAQRQALRIRDNGCAIPQCGVDAAYTQPHHVVGWAVGGTTDLDQMVSLCFVHHRMTELGRFQFIPRKDHEPQPPGALEHPLWWILPPVSFRT